MKTNLLFVVSLLSVALGLVSCAKDITTDDYRQKQVQEEETKIQNVAGTYKGALVSQGVTVGGLTFSFSPTLTVVSGGSDAINEQQVVMSGTMTITTPGQEAKILNFSNGSYYDVTQSFTITIPISALGTSGTPTTQNAAVVQVSGNFNDDGSLSGTIQANSYPDTMSTFSLTKGGTLPASSSAASSDRYATNELPTLQYSGTAKFNTGLYAGTTEAVALTIDNPDFSRPDLAFYDFFLPIKSVTATVILGNAGADTIFSGAVWDLRDGTLTGSGVSTAQGDGSFNLSLNCMAGAGSPSKSWTCDYLSSAGDITLTLNQSK